MGFAVVGIELTQGKAVLRLQVLQVAQQAQNGRNQCANVRQHEVGDFGSVLRICMCLFQILSASLRGIGHTFSPRH